jgi:septum site-determining protein MinC
MSATVAASTTVPSSLRDGAAAELKQSQCSMLCLRLGALDLDAVQDWLTGAAVALELDAVAQELQATQLQDLVARLRFCGLKPVAVIAASDSPLADLAEAADLPVIAHSQRGGRSSTSSAEHPVPEARAESTASGPAAAQQTAPAAVEATPAAPAAAAPTLRSDQPVRSGQQIYARGTDLVLTAAVSAGAEVIADGSIHIYGRLSGKALAGARGATDARIYCLAFDAELVSIAGRFRVFESVPAELKGKACHLYLNGDRLEIQPLQ